MKWFEPNLQKLLLEAGTDGLRISHIVRNICNMEPQLFGEGHLYFDFVRNNYWPNEHLMGSVKYRQKGYYWPVSSNVLSTNTLIDQTPYWNGKCMW